MTVATVAELELYAHQLAAIDRCVLLVGKRPVHRNWPDATPSKDVIAQSFLATPDLNVGYKTGHGIAVLDVDPRNGGEDSLRRLQTEHGALPATRTVITGSGGTHYYFAARRDLGSRVVADGLDLKANGGQVVAPGSTHPTTGRLYVDHPARGRGYPLAELPAWLDDGRRPSAHEGTYEPGDDVLGLIPATEYVPDLTGRQLDRRGCVQCPVHGGGQERTPSLLAGGKNPRLWWCFGCAVGGGIYQLAGHLAGYELPLRGVPFLQSQEAVVRIYERKWGIDA